MAQARNVRTTDNAQGGAQSPTAAKSTVKVANGVTYVTDSKGRQIGLKKLKPSQRFELDDKLEGKTLSAAMQIKFVASVVSIDQEGMPPLDSRQDLLARLDLLGDEGLEAIVGVTMEMYGIDLSVEEKTEAKK